MFPHNRPGFWLTAKDWWGKIRALRFYEDLETLVNREGYYPRAWRTKHDRFAESYDDYVDDHYWDNAHRPLDDLGLLITTNKPYVVVDHNENIVPLCELNRIVNNRPWPRFRHYWRRGGRRNAYGGGRRPKTYQEKKAYYDTLDQEVPVKVRSRRKAHNLVDLWDDKISHNEKCWKRQSKRRHQWRAK
jgi:hypothetical protein